MADSQKTFNVVLGAIALASGIGFAILAVVTAFEQRMPLSPYDTGPAQVVLLALSATLALGAGLGIIVSALDPETKAFDGLIDRPAQADQNEAAK